MDMKNTDHIATHAMPADTVKGRKPRRAVAPETDGRIERSVVTRQKIVDAATALVYEGHVAPTAQQVADRSGIGLRTVFRHFDDMDALYSEFSHRFDEQIEPLLLLRLEGMPWQERVLKSIDIRAGLYEEQAPLLVSCRVHRHTSPFLAQRVMEWAHLEREMLLHMLPKSLHQNVTLVDAMCMALSFETWTRLRREQALDQQRALAVVRFTVEALLANTEQCA